jgi:Ca-activated chloride channel family protein
VFVVGIGSSPAETHLRRLAQATGGACDFVAPGEAVEPAVIRMFARLRSPQVTDLHLAWPAEVKPLWVSPLLASVFDGDTVNVFALLERAPSGDLQFLGKFANDVIPRKIGHATLTPDLHTVGTLSRLGAAARLQDDLNEEWEDAISLAVDYQLVTNETNFLLIHARADHAKATEMPELETVRQMVPAGWAGNGTVNYRSHGNYFESRATPYISSHTPSLNNSATQYAVPAFCRQVPSMQPPNRNAPNNSLRSRLDANLTPFELAGQLRTSPMTVWPSSYDGLKAWGIDQSVTDWLEYAMASLTASENREQEVVEAFLFLMSGRETYESLVQSQGLATAFSLILQRLWGMFASGATPAPADTSNQINALLVKAMTEALSTMTNSTWPDSVFVFE